MQTIMKYIGCKNLPFASWSMIFAIWSRSSNTPQAPQMQKIENVLNKILLHLLSLYLSIIHNLKMYSYTKLAEYIYSNRLLIFRLFNFYSVLYWRLPPELRCVFGSSGPLLTLVHSASS